MTHNTKQWLWRWHIIAGIICLPIVLLLSITGGVYLFKDQYEASSIEKLKQVSNTTASRLTYQEQWDIVNNHWDITPTGIIIPENNNEATQFISGRFSHKSSLFIDPYSGKINGQIKQNETNMHQVRKLHGELLMGSFGTKIIELIASWMIVLILSGIYVFWPKKGSYKSLIIIRLNKGKRTLFRDLHTVIGFWFSIILLVILAGGLPWTDVFGNGFKWVQKQTNTGYPTEWKAPKLQSSESNTKRLTLDDIIEQANQLNLDGETQITWSKSLTNAFSISNQTSNLSKLHKYHINPFTGKILYHGTWDNIGVFMKTRLYVMAFHQGQFGYWNWCLVLITTVALFFLCLSALFSYLYKRQKGTWGVPPAQHTYRVGKPIVGSLVLLGLLLPMFGLSLLCIYIITLYSKNRISH